MVVISTAALLILIIIACLAFAMSNGYHNASAVMAMIVCSGAASPRQAILLASAFGLAGAVFGGTAVADTVAGLIDLPPDKVLLPILFSAILGAVLWSLLTGRLGLPSSSTHALTGGIIGAVSASSGTQYVSWGWTDLLSGSHRITGIVMVTFALIVSPLAGFVLAFILGKITQILFRNAKIGLNIWLNRLEWLITGLLSYSFGANDTQKIIGILVLALAASGRPAVPTSSLWLRISAGLVMFMGMLFGGWNITKTIGRGIYDMRPIHSVNSQLASMGSIFAATMLGAPVATIHVIVGSIMGTGSAERYKTVNWQIVKEIVAAWFITIPSSAVISAIIFVIWKFIFKVT